MVKGNDPHDAAVTENIVLSAPASRRLLTVTGEVLLLLMLIVRDAVFPVAMVPKSTAMGAMARCPSTREEGAFLAITVPSPSCPLLLLPQASRVPSALRATVWLPPFLTDIQAPALPFTCTGAE